MPRFSAAALTLALAGYRVHRARLALMGLILLRVPAAAGAQTSAVPRVDTVLRGVQACSSRLERLRGTANCVVYLSEHETEYLASRARIYAREHPDVTWEAVRPGQGLYKLRFDIAQDAWRVEVACLAPLGGGGYWSFSIDGAGQLQYIVEGATAGQGFSWDASDNHLSLWPLEDLAWSEFLHHPLAEHLMMVCQGETFDTWRNIPGLDYGGTREYLGTTCHILRAIDAPVNDCYALAELWVAPDYGWLVLRAEHYQVVDAGTQEFDGFRRLQVVEDVGCTDGVWFPTRSTISLYRYLPGKCGWRSIKTMEFDEINVDTQASDPWFGLPFPPLASRVDDKVVGSVHIEGATDTFAQRWRNVPPPVVDEYLTVPQRPQPTRNDE